MIQRFTFTIFLLLLVGLVVAGCAGYGGYGGGSSSATATPAKVSRTRSRLTTSRSAAGRASSISLRRPPPSGLRTYP